MPVLAICRGIQILNVALGGTLVQDIASQCETNISHDEDGPRDSRSHAVTIEPGSLIAQAVGIEHLTVNSFHHQSVKRVADGMRVLAFGTRDPNDITYYPRSRKIMFRGVGVIGRLEQLDYWEGEG